jgi:hypothetical protein
MVWSRIGIIGVALLGRQQAKLCGIPHLNVVPRNRSTENASLMARGTVD